MLDFHVDGFARALMNLPERLVIPVPNGVSERDAACAQIAFSTVQHMLFEVPIDDVAPALKRMESRQVFGKIIVYL